MSNASEAFPDGWFLRFRKVLDWVTPMGGDEDVRLTVFSFTNIPEEDW